jgi:predicted esterase
MIAALLLAAALPASPPPGQVERAAALRVRYDVLYRRVTEPRLLDPAVKAALIERTALGAQTATELATLAAEPNAVEALADLERRADLDEMAVPALLASAAPALTAAPGAHAGIARAGAGRGGRDEAFAYWIPAGYDPRAPGPLVVLFHGAIQPETDLVARAFFRGLADASNAILLAPGGNDRDADAMLRSLEAAERALRPVIAWDAKRRYLGGFSNGVFGAFHAVALQNAPCAGFLGIAGYMVPTDLHGVSTHLDVHGAFLVTGTYDTVIPSSEVRKVADSLRRERVPARLYEVPGAPHGLRALYPAIARAWRDMLAGVTKSDDVRVDATSSPSR